MVLNGILGVFGAVRIGEKNGGTGAIFGNVMVIRDSLGSCIVVCLLFCTCSIFGICIGDNMGVCACDGLCDVNGFIVGTTPKMGTVNSASAGTWVIRNKFLSSWVNRVRWLCEDISANPAVGTMMDANPREKTDGTVTGGIVYNGDLKSAAEI